MILVSSRNCTESDLSTFVTEASTLGLPKDQWPEQLRTCLGNAQAFEQYSYVLVDESEDLRWITYRQMNSDIMLRVHNA